MIVCYDDCTSTMDDTHDDECLVIENFYHLADFICALTRERVRRFGRFGAMFGSLDSVSYTSFSRMRTNRHLMTSSPQQPWHG